MFQNETLADIRDHGATNEAHQVVDVPEQKREGDHGIDGVQQGEPVQGTAKKI